MRRFFSFFFSVWLFSLPVFSFRPDGKERKRRNVSHPLLSSPALSRSSSLSNRYFPPLLLSSWTAAAGVVWGVATGLAYSRLGGGHGGSGSGSSSSPLPWQEAAAVGAVCGALAWAALSAVAAVLLSAVDALFFCYAADRARAAEEAGGESGLGGAGAGGGFRTRAEVHEVLDRVPCGVIVQQPDGGVSYGAPVGGGGVKKHVPPGEMFSRG